MGKFIAERLAHAPHRCCNRRDCRIDRLFFSAGCGRCEWQRLSLHQPLCIRRVGKAQRQPQPCFRLCHWFLSAAWNSRFRPDFLQCRTAKPAIPEKCRSRRRCSHLYTDFTTGRCLFLFKRLSECRLSGGRPCHLRYCGMSEPLRCAHAVVAAAICSYECLCLHGNGI